MKKLLSLSLFAGLSLVGPVGLATAGPTPFEQQLQLAGQPAVKIHVKRDGWYKVGRAQLVKAGFATAAPSRLLQLYADGKQVPMLLRGVKGGRLAPTGWIEFFGTQRNLATTETRTYWLVVGKDPGRRIEILPPARQRIRRATPRSFEYTLVSNERSTYYSFLREPSNFFGQFIRSDGATEKLGVHHLDPRSKRAILEVTLKGASRLPHQVRVALNGTELGVTAFDKRESVKPKFRFNASLLKEGENTVVLTSLKGETDVSLVGDLRLTYAHLHEADNDKLTLAVHGRMPMRVRGFTQRALRVVDVTRPDRLRVLRPTVTRSGSGFAVTVPPAKHWRRLLTVAPKAMSRPVAVTRERPSNLYSADGGADLLIISHRSFMKDVERLRAHRERQGLKVAVVDVEDLYDEFAFGKHDPEPIKRFVERARERWKPSPRFVLLVGDATADPLDLLRKGANDFVPTKLINTTISETAFDDWFVDSNNDGRSELPLGRLPVRTPAHASAVVSKIIAYDGLQRSPGERWALLVADKNDAYFDFESVNERLRRVVAPGMTTEILNRGKGPTDAAVRQRLLQRLNQGPAIVNYFGHGGPTLWADSGLLESKDVDDLRNSDQLSFYVATTCNTGYFVDPERAALGEALLTAPHGGAAAVFASSGYVDAYGQARLGEELYRILFQDPTLTLAEVTMLAKRVVHDQDILRTFTFLGDPTMRLR